MDPEEKGPEHIDRLNTIEKLEAEGFSGSDVCLMVSLFEYGLAWREIDEEILFVYGIKVGHNGDYIRFDRCSLPKTIDPRSEWNWVDWGTIADYSDQSEEKVLAEPLPRIVDTLLWYYGHENVFGSSYWEGFAITGDDQHDHNEEEE